MALNYVMTLQGPSPKPRVQLMGFLTPFQTHPVILGLGLVIGGFFGWRTMRRG